MLDNWIDPIKDHVAFSNAYINWEDFKTKLKEGNETAWLEFDKITSELAREYGKDVEKNYSDDAYADGYEECEKEYEDKISDLEDEISDLEDDLRREAVYTEYLEDLLDKNEIN